MSFLTDPALLYANGRAYAELAPERAQGRAAKVAAAATLATFLATGVALLADHPWTRPFTRTLGYRSGRQFMFGFPFPGRELPDGLAVAAFATYPVWLWLGWDRGRRSR